MEGSNFVYCSRSRSKEELGNFLVVVFLIHRLMHADISCTTTAQLFFFTLLGIVQYKVTMVVWNKLLIQGRYGCYIGKC